jgi:Ca2+-binding RTX toxin-like protein
MIRRLRVLAIVAGLLLCIGGALTATNTVASSRTGFGASSVTANDLKPPVCAALTLTAVTVVNGGGNNQSQLIIGTAGADNLNGGNAGDCIVGGAGNDRLNGGAGTDICVGGPGIDTFHQSCETQIQ